jgi:uncharacterized membrane protein
LSSEQKSERLDELDIDLKSWSKRDELREVALTLLSHHPPSLYGHCMRLSFRGRSVYFCGRCTGIYGGLALGILGIFLLRINLEPDWMWFFVALALGLSTVVDWMSQRLTPRKTRNGIRFSTGFMSGVGLAIVFYLANLFYMLITLLIMIVSVGGVSIIENRRARFHSGTIEREIEPNDEVTTESE